MGCVVGVVRCLQVTGYETRGVCGVGAKCKGGVVYVVYIIISLQNVAR